MMLAPLAPGTLLHNRYRIVGVAAQGQFGQTYLAQDQKRSQALCILKEFALPTSDPQKLEALREKFQATTSHLYKLQHSQLPRHQVLIIEGDRGYWVREYIEGKDYRTLMQERAAVGQSFSQAEVLKLLEQVLPVLDYLHQQGVIHRNVSLDSLILRDRDQRPVLVNYGLVKELVAQLQSATIDLKPSKADPNLDRVALANLVVTLLSGLENRSRTQVVRQILANPDFTQLLPSKYFQTSKQAARSTLAASRSFAPGLDRSNPALSASQPVARVQRRSRSKSDPLSSTALVISLILLVAAASFRLTSRNPSALEPPPTVTTSPQPSSPPKKPVPDSAAPLPVPTPPPPPQGVGGADEPAKLQSFHTAVPEALRDRRRQLGIDFPFFARLVDEAFYAKYPELKRRKLGTGGEQEKYRSEWNTIATTLMDKLQQIPPEIRGKLGTYQRSHYDQWLKTIGEPNNRKLSNLTDQRFLELFPDQKDKPQNPQTYGQVWYAIAHEQSQRKEFQP